MYFQSNPPVTISGVARLTVAGFAMVMHSMAPQATVPTSYEFKTQADEAYAQGDFPKIVKLATAYIGQHPDDAEGHKRRGWAHFCLGDFEAAIDDSNVAIGLQASDRELRYNRGVSYARLGKYHLAVRELDAVIELDPREADFKRREENANATFDLDLDEMVDLESQEPDLDAILEPASLTAKAYLERGIVRALRGQKETANEDYLSAAWRDPEVHHNQLRFANWLRDLGYYQRAVAEYDALLALSPQDSEYHSERAFAHWYSGALPEAEAEFTRSYQCLGNSASAAPGTRWSRSVALSRRGLLRGAMGKDDEAVADLEKAMADVEADFGAGVNLEEAYGLFASGVEEIRAEVPRLRFHYGFLLHESGRRAEAAEHFRAAKEERPDIMAVQEERLEPFRAGARTLFEKELEVARRYFGGGAPPQPGVAASTESPTLFGEKAMDSVAPRRRPSIQIHDLAVSPGIVAPGGNFAVDVNYTAVGARDDDAELPAMLSFSIKQGERVLKKVPPKTVMTPNGVRTTTTQHLTAAKRKGSYAIVVTLALGSRTAEQTAGFEIQ